MQMAYCTNFVTRKGKGMCKDREATEVKVEEELSEEVLEKVSGGVSETDDVAEMLRAAFVWRSASDK